MRRQTPALQPSTFNLHPCLAFTLIECLVWVAMLAMIFGFILQLFFSGRAGADGLRRNADDITRALHAGERWREDVRTATAPPRLIEQDGHRQLVVQTGTNVIAYAFFEDTVWRRPQTNQAWQPALVRVKASRMEADPRERITAWRWELELQAKDPKKRVTPLFTFLAATPKEPRP
ncbi:MAG: hypothetical protein EBS05_08625 [Proteobacteria bacterium]|nr:hypothetical protein [Pseudomonadota bacterium]